MADIYGERTLAVHLVSDYIHPLPRGGRCRVRIYVPDEEGLAYGDAPVVICSELPENRDTSVASVAERVAAEVLSSHGLGRAIWVEHYGHASTNGTTDTFELLAFSSYEVREARAPYLGEAPLTLGRTERKPLDRATVERLAGRGV